MSCASVRAHQHVDQFARSAPFSAWLTRIAVHAQTAVALEISEDNVKIRLHRGRATVQGWLLQRVGAEAKDAFPFMGARCGRVVQSVFARLS